MFDDFDEPRYLAANPDVCVMLERGLFGSAQEHWQKTGAAEHALGYRRSGFYEHDLLYDEAAYLAQNQDVVRLLRARLMGSGYEHWMRFGRFEFLRGQRWGPFAARPGQVRPFRIVVPGRGVVVGAAAGEGPAPTVRVRVGVAPAEALSPAHVRKTPELTLADACGRRLQTALLLCFIPLGGAAAPLPPVTIIAGSPPSSTFSVRDEGRQALFLASDLDASAFIRTATALVEDEDRARELEAAAVTFAVERLHRPVPKGPERPPPVAVFVETIEVREAHGFLLGGWVLPDLPSIERLRVYCPETAETADVLPLVTAVGRPDVHESLVGRNLATTTHMVGFSVIAPLPAASLRGARRLLFGITPRGGGEHWVESSESKNPSA